MILITRNLTVNIPSSQVRARRSQCEIELLCDNEGFIVKKENTFKRVHSYNTDKEFRKMDLKDIIKYTFMNKFEVLELSDGDYKVNMLCELKGGGTLGATIGFFTGRFLVYFIGYGAIAIISSFTGYAAPTTALALGGTFGHIIASTGSAVAIGAGILGGALTGPV